jgi:hypothetical protein
MQTTASWEENAFMKYTPMDSGSAMHTHIVTITFIASRIFFSITHPNLILQRILKYVGAEVCFTDLHSFGCGASIYFTGIRISKKSKIFVNEKILQINEFLRHSGSMILGKSVPRGVATYGRAAKTNKTRKRTSASAYSRIRIAHCSESLNRPSKEVS